MSGSRRRGLVGGLIFTILGFVFLLEALEVFTLAPATLWPVLLLALGIGVLAGIGRDGEDEEQPGIR
jgi:ABC-type antimicrobial peptide transport system permease subunit